MDASVDEALSSVGSAPGTALGSSSVEASDCTRLIACPGQRSGVIPKEAGSFGGFVPPWLKRELARLAALAAAAPTAALIMETGDGEGGW